MQTITPSHARRVLLAAQGLLSPPTHPATKADVLATIRRMQVLQIDTIHVVARSPYLVLWSRLGAYQARWLDELLAEGQLFEYWSHEACFLPIEDYPWYRALMVAGMSRSWVYSQTWLEEHADQMTHLKQLISQRGEVRSADFARTDGQKSGWWNWKFEKMALEMLHTSGELMIARRERFQRIYSLRQHLLPTWDDTQTPSLEQARRWFALAAIHALGVAPARWVADYFRTKKRETPAVINQLLDEGALKTVKLQGSDELWYYHPNQTTLLEQAMAGALVPQVTTLLSPFDPIVWDRARALELFGFDYRIECYTPAPKRRYGYFSLPILFGDQLVGRLDAKAHRQERLFEIKTIFLEPGVPLSEPLLTELSRAIQACANWHQTPNVVVRWSEPADLAPALEAALSVR